MDRSPAWMFIQIEMQRPPCQNMSELELVKEWVENSRPIFFNVLHLVPIFVVNFQTAWMFIQIEMQRPPCQNMSELELMKKWVENCRPVFLIIFQ